MPGLQIRALITDVSLLATKVKALLLSLLVPGTWGNRGNLWDCGVVGYTHPPAPPITSCNQGPLPTWGQVFIFVKRALYPYSRVPNAGKTVRKKDKFCSHGAYVLGRVKR